MNTKRSTLLAAAISAILIPVSASAEALTITVLPALSPNLTDANGNTNASFATWVTNADNALANSLTTAGAAGPSQYNQQSSSVGTGALTTTNFNSWLGSVYTSAGFGNEAGNALLFGVVIQATSGTFNLNQLGFYLSDAVGDFTFGTQAAPITGYDFGTEAGLLGFNGSTPVTDDAAPLTTIIYVGSGTSLEADCTFGVDCGNLPVEQGYIDNVLANNGLTPFDNDVLTGTYELVDPNTGNPILDGNGNPIQGSGTFTITPEPSTWLLIASAIPAVAALRRRPKSS